MTTTTYFIDTNAGPIVRRPFPSVAACKVFVETHIPLLSKRGYSHTWTKRGDWHVIDIANSRGRHVHSAAFRRDGGRS